MKKFQTHIEWSYNQIKRVIVFIFYYCHKKFIFYMYKYTLNNTVKVYIKY